MEEEGAGCCYWAASSWMTRPPPLHLAGLRISSFTSNLGVSGANVPWKEEEPEPDDDEPVLLGAQRFGGAPEL